MRRPGDPGPGRAGHLVLVVAVAVRHVRLAPAHRRPATLLPRAHARHGARDPVLVGLPDDHERLPLPGEAAVHDRVPARHGARHAAPQDVQVARQRHRPARCGAAVRRGRAALDLDRKSTRLNSSHGYISYAVFCLKKKKQMSTDMEPVPYQLTGPLQAISLVLFEPSELRLLIPVHTISIITRVQSY